MNRKIFQSIMVTMPLLLLLTLCKSQSQEMYVLEVYNCESMRHYEIRKDSLLFTGFVMGVDGQYKTVIKLGKPETEALQSEIRNFLDEPEDEVLINKCFMDGLNYKLKINSNGVTVKRVFIGNYFDRRFNSLGLLINQSLQDHDHDIQIRYVWEDDQKIKELIDDQDNCEEATEEQKQSKLNDWCKF